jgi:hypothetical protein
MNNAKASNIIVAELIAYALAKQITSTYQMRVIFDMLECKNAYMRIGNGHLQDGNIELAENCFKRADEIRTEIREVETPILRAIEEKEKAA